MNEDLEFERLLIEKRHSELIVLLTKMLNKPSSTTDLKKIESLLTLLSEKKEDNIPKSIQILSESIIKSQNKLISTIEELKNKKGEWTFEIIRNTYGNIYEVKAIQNK
jgi:hypothetical protein